MKKKPSPRFGRVKIKPVSKLHLAWSELFWRTVGERNPKNHQLGVYFRFGAESDRASRRLHAGVP